ncbi:MAG: TylF/MycF/NovP-related O-methyltransferase [Ginsengibacter sp.]
MFFIKGINYIFGRCLNSKKIHLNFSLNYCNRKREIDIQNLDYIRLATLELMAHEVNSNGLVGNVAEVGVYKGKFAKFINQYFPERKLYLFDTFESFDEKDIQKENNLGLGNPLQDFSNTSVELVLQQMPFAKQCIIRQGFFPETAVDIEDSFVFVNLDTDLYEPIYQGLLYFYPKIAKGGYLMVHDVNNDNYRGARQAVEQFCEETGNVFTPLPDACGSVIFAKK